LNKGGKGSELGVSKSPGKRVQKEIGGGREIRVSKSPEKRVQKEIGGGREMGVSKSPKPRKQKEISNVNDLKVSKSPKPRKQKEIGGGREMGVSKSPEKLKKKKTPNPKSEPTMTSVQLGPEQQMVTSKARPKRKASRSRSPAPLRPTQWGPEEQIVTSKTRDNPKFSKSPIKKKSPTKKDQEKIDLEIMQRKFREKRELANAALLSKLQTKNVAKPAKSVSKSPKPKKRQPRETTEDSTDIYGNFMTQIPKKTSRIPNEQLEQSPARNSNKHPNTPLNPKIKKLLSGPKQPQNPITKGHE
jgi:hypothetical protein